MTQRDDEDVPLCEQPLEVLVSVESPTDWVDPAAVQSAAHRILADADINYGEVSLALVDDGTIHELNRRYLSHDYPTDVLSFPFDGGSGWLQGEIIVSTETAERASGEFGWPPASELMLYVIHGTLHLVGHDDKQEQARQEMGRAERRYLIEAGIAIPSDSSLFERPGWEVERT